MRAEDSELYRLRLELLQARGDLVAARAWMQRALRGLATLVELDRLLVGMGARRMDYIDDIGRLIDECPLPDEDES